MIEGKVRTKGSLVFSFPFTPDCFDVTVDSGFSDAFPIEGKVRTKGSLVFSFPFTPDCFDVTVDSGFSEASFRVSVMRLFVVKLSRAFCLLLVAGRIPVGDDTDGFPSLEDCCFLRIEDNSVTFLLPLMIWYIL